MAVSPDTVTRQMSEKDLQQCVLDTARLFSWRCYHPWRSDHSAAGFPDTVCIRARPGESPRLLFIELKSERGRLSHEQQEWLTDLMRLQMTAATLGSPLLIQIFVWRPADWHDGTIETVLRGD